MVRSNEKTKRKSVSATAAAFGAAMASLYVTPEIQADEIELTFSPGTVYYNLYFPQNVAIDQLGLGFRLWNDFNSMNGFGYKTVVADSLSSVGLVQSGEIVSPETFSGDFLAIINGQPLSSTVFVGFRSAGNVGWFKMDLGGVLMPIVFLDGRYGSEGENLVVGGGSGPLLGDVNCDGFVDFLDIDPFVQLLNSGEYLDKADINQDGVVDFLDIGPFVDLLDQDLC